MYYSDKKCLIAYFSHRGYNYASGKIVDLPIGNTQVAADIIRGNVDGDMFFIERQEKYPRSYEDVVAEAKKEKLDNARPPLRYDVDSIAPYDVIFLGYPNWCGTMPMAVWTFLENHDFTGKCIKPFCTHEGSGFGHSLEDIRSLVPTATLGKGIMIFGTTVMDAEGDIKRWLSSGDR